MLHLSAQFTSYLPLLGYVILVTQAVVAFVKGGYQNLAYLKARPNLYTFTVQGTAIVFALALTLYLAIMVSYVSAPVEIVLTVLIGFGVGLAAMGHYEVLTATLKQFISQQLPASVAGTIAPLAPLASVQTLSPQAETTGTSDAAGIPSST